MKYLYIFIYGVISVILSNLVLLFLDDSRILISIFFQLLLVLIYLSSKIYLGRHKITNCIRSKIKASKQILAIIIDNSISSIICILGLKLMPTNTILSVSIMCFSISYFWLRNLFTRSLGEKITGINKVMEKDKTNIVLFIQNIWLSLPITLGLFIPATWDDHIHIRNFDIIALSISCIPIIDFLSVVFRKSSNKLSDSLFGIKYFSISKNNTN
ncbi:hypothetical protein [Spirochaeta cellobiosiphila]|uniref:hypothetical protein n=1 Tax=Spirochaeta cellobiosiphila TaxID=504483 RepID=UPI00040FE9BA|nr:hypothetical protein [Spirochaeta cellobiosiphila]